MSKEGRTHPTFRARHTSESSHWQRKSFRTKPFLKRLNVRTWNVASASAVRVSTFIDATADRPSRNVNRSLKFACMSTFKTMSCVQMKWCALTVAAELRRLNDRFLYYWNVESTCFTNCLKLLPEARPPGIRRRYFRQLQPLVRHTPYCPETDCSQIGRLRSIQANSLFDQKLARVRVILKPDSALSMSH